MNKKIFLIFMFFINIMFLNFNNPLILGILMLMQIMNMTMLMGKIYYSFWFSYIIFLVFIGGLFILFIYIISLIYNNKYYSKNNFIILFLLLIMFNLNYNFMFFNNYEMKLFFIFMKENSINSLKFYNYPNNLINLLLINYLLMLMIIVVKITNFFIGPIRSN